jgi:hypothetical protein
MGLSTDPSNGSVTGFSFSVIKNDRITCTPPSRQLVDMTITSGTEATTLNLAPINSFVIVLVAENGGVDTVFSKAQGIFYCHATNNLAVSNGDPTIDVSLNTVENGNIVYLSLAASYPNGEFYQLFGIGSV